MLKAAVGFIHSKLVFDRRAMVLAGLVANLLPDRAAVLDVGTGNGRIAKLWCEARPDISVEGLDVLVREDSRIPVREFDGRTIPYADKSVDVVTFVDVLHHSDDAHQLLLEAGRVARHALIIKDHLAENKLDHAVLRAMDWVGNAPHGVVLPYNYLSCTKWLSLFKDAGLDLRTLSTDVPLYPPPLSIVIGRKLHFVAELRPGPAVA